MRQGLDLTVLFPESCTMPDTQINKHYQTRLMDGQGWNLGTAHHSQVSFQNFLLRSHFQGVMVKLRATSYRGKSRFEHMAYSAKAWLHFFFSL